MPAGGRRAHAARQTTPYRKAEAAPPARASAWGADEALDTELLALARALAEGAPAQGVPIAELGEQVAAKLRRKAVHPTRDGKIVRLSAYMRAVHDGWEAFLQARVAPPLHVDRKQGRLLVTQASAVEGMYVAADTTASSAAPRKRAASVSVDDLDLSRM
ncbi:hypothetical protein T492DRAFT_855230 [Pavlovales sp. CCMP2436]|nr:hypothetical protein T492DRAFT_855230 [Pavlovales sp. CCMP2436]